MSQLEKRRVPIFKEPKSKKLQKLEDNFTGFDANDDLTNSIEIKTKRIKDIEKELNDKRKSQSKQISLPEKDGKRNRNSKKLKKENTQTILDNSLNTSDQCSLELTTPTFNLTTMSKNRRGGRKVKDIKDPLYLLPFDNGWKRELVYRNTESLNNKGVRNADVYYYGPNSKKLRSLKEVQLLLNVLPEDYSLTIDNFTFTKFPIGVNDESKELIRDANDRFLKEEEIFWITMKTTREEYSYLFEEKVTQPVTDVELSDDIERKTPKKLKIPIKSKKKPKSKSKKDKILVDLESASTPATMPEELQVQACQSNSKPTVSSPKRDDKTSITEVNSTEVNSTEVNSTEVNSTEVNSTEVHSTKVHSTKVHSTKVNSTKVNSTKVNSTKVNSTEVNSTEVHSTEINSTDVKQRSSTSDGEIMMLAPCGMRCPNSGEPATLMCAQCLVYYHPACVNLNVNLKIVGYVCINCRTLVRQRNRRVQSTHTVVVGVSEPEQMRVEPIRIRQVHQVSDSPNFFIEKTSVSKTEKQNNEIDERIDETDAALNTVLCQGIAYESAMWDDVFHEQYVFEMKQTRGPSLMTCVVQEPKNLDVSSQMNEDLPLRNWCMQSFNDMVMGLSHVFTYLNIKELVIASKVCSSWNMISKDKRLWRYVHLKNVMVYNWENLINILIQKQSITLDTRRMLIPYKALDFENFWASFCYGIKNATQLHELELYRCPVNVVHECMAALPQLSVLNASSIKNPNAPKDTQVINEFKTINLSYVSRMVNLKQLRLKGLSGFKLEFSPTLTFKNMPKLRTLSLTSVKSFPKNICLSLETVTTDLEHLEIGDCECIPDDFPMLIKRFTNLKILRLENCCGRWEQFAREALLAIRSLKKLTVLELINIEFSNCVEEELEKFTSLESLLIIPAYVSQSATTNRHLFDCFKNLSKTLKYVVWGLTHELLRVTDLFISQYQQNQHTLGYSIDISQTNDASNNIPILRTRTPKPRTEDLAVAKDDEGEDTSDNVDILSVSALQKLLDKTMVNAKTKVIKVAYSATTRIYIQEQFPEVRFI